MITWSCEIRRQTINITSSLQHYLWPPNLAGWSLTLRHSYLKGHMALDSLSLVRLRDKLKPYLNYQKSYKHQTCQDSHHEELPLIKSYISLIISKLATCLWPPELAGWWLTWRGSYLWSHMVSRGFARWRDKLKTHLPYHNAMVTRVRRMATYF